MWKHYYLAYIGPCCQLLEVGKERKDVSLQRYYNNACLVLWWVMLTKV